MDQLLKTKKEYKSLKKQEIKETFFQKKLNKARFQHDMTYGDFKDLPRRRTSDKVLCDKAFNIAKKTKHDRYQHGLSSIV